MENPKFKPEPEIKPAVNPFASEQIIRTIPEKGVVPLPIVGGRINRFKFRGVLTVAYGGENADDKTIDLIIEKADAIYSGDIGFDIDQLDAAIEKAGITDDIEIDQIHAFCYDNNGCRNDEYFVMNGDIEQCTGFSDRDGNLIYEGDLIKSPNNSYPLEIVRMPNGVYGCKVHKTSPVWEMNLYSLINAYEVEIIGNIHEINKLWLHYELEKEQQ